MVHTKHLSRSLAFGINLDEIPDNDGYASKTPSTVSSSQATSVAPSPRTLTRTMLHATDQFAQDYLQQDRANWSLINRRYPEQAEKADWSNGQWGAPETSPDWNPLEAVWLLHQQSNRVRGKSTAPPASSAVQWQRRASCTAHHPTEPQQSFHKPYTRGLPVHQERLRQYPIAKHQVLSGVRIFRPKNGSRTLRH
ncbi:hypothetical protein LTR08_005611 [Meristemomyces frigidus]|nr:hypothetical protein LTR08_005611 [Meristemomyces frigidus]